MSLVTRAACLLYANLAYGTKSGPATSGWASTHWQPRRPVDPQALIRRPGRATEYAQLRHWRAGATTLNICLGLIYHDLTPSSHN